MGAGGRLRARAGDGALVSDDTTLPLRVSEDGRLVVDWSRGRGPVRFTPEAFERWVAHVNELRDENAKLRGDFDRKRNGRWSADVYGRSTPG